MTRTNSALRWATPARRWSWRWLSGRPEVLAVLLAVLYLPFALLGYGNDIDVPNVLRAGRSWLDGDYELSRRPGSTPTELGSAVLDRVGGSVLVNLASVAFAAVALACLGRILQRDGNRRPGLAMLVLGLQPWYWIAATSLGDFTWSLGALLAGVDSSQRQRRIAAGLWFGLAIGCRASAVFLVAAWLVAEQLGERRSRPVRDATGLTAAVAVVVAGICFLPPWREAGFGFVESGLDAAGWGTQLGRWATKNLAVFGVAGAVVLVAMAPIWLGAVRRWSTSAVVRFAVLGLLATELLFLRLPLKPVHLLPAVAFVALLAGASPRATPRWLGVLIASQVLHAVVSLQVAEPDEIDAATTGRFEPALVAGVLITDVDCRLDDRERGPWPDPAEPAEREAAEARGEANFACQQRSWRGD